MAARLSIPVMLISTWQPYGLEDDVYTVGVKAAINEVIVDVNAIIRDYANNPQPLQTLVFVVDVWRVFVDTMLNRNRPQGLYNLSIKGSFGIRIGPQGNKLWAEEFTRCQDKALNDYHQHYLDWREHHGDDFIFPLLSYVNQSANFEAHNQQRKLRRSRHQSKEATQVEEISLPAAPLIQIHRVSLPRDNIPSISDSPASPTPTGTFRPASPTVEESTNTGDVAIPSPLLMPPPDSVPERSSQLQPDSADTDSILSPPKDLNRSFLSHSDRQPDAPVTSTGLPLTPLLAAMDTTTIDTFVSQLCGTPEGRAILYEKGFLPRPIPCLQESPVNDNTQSETSTTDVDMISQIVPTASDDPSGNDSDIQICGERIPPPPARWTKPLKELPINVHYLPATVPRRQTREVPLRYTNFGAKLIDPAAAMQIDYRFTIRHDGLLYYSNDYTYLQRAALPANYKNIDQVPYVPLFLLYFVDRERWEQYLNTLAGPPRQTTMNHANDQRRNFSRRLLEILRPFTLCSSDSIVVDKEFMSDQHQPLLHSILAKLLYYFQFPNGEEPPKAIPLWKFRPNFDEFQVDLDNIATAMSAFRRQLQPSTMLLLIWGQFGMYFESTIRTLPSEMQWLCMFELALDYYNQHFPDIIPNKRHFPFPDIRPYVNILVPKTTTAAPTQPGTSSG